MVLGARDQLYSSSTPGQTSKFIIVFADLGIEPRSFSLSYIPSPSLLFILRQGFIAKLPRLGSNFQHFCLSFSKSRDYSVCYHTQPLRFSYNM